MKSDERCSRSLKMDTRSETRKRYFVILSDLEALVVGRCFATRIGTGRKI